MSSSAGYAIIGVSADQIDEVMNLIQIKHGSNVRFDVGPITDESDAWFVYTDLFPVDVLNLGYCDVTEQVGWSRSVHPTWPRITARTFIKQGGINNEDHVQFITNPDGTVWGIIRADREGSGPVWSTATTSGGSSD